MDYTNNIYINNIIFQNMNFNLNISNDDINYLCFLSKLYTKNLDYLSSYLDNINTEKLNILLNKSDENNVYAIHYLCINKNFNVDYLKLYLKYNSKLSFEDEKKNIIYFLLKYDNLSLDVINYLNELKFNFNFSDIDTKHTMYHYLASSNIVLEDNILNKIFEILDKNNINKKNSYEITPILMSSRLNNTQICNFLIKKNCDLNLTNSTLTLTDI